MIRGLLEHADKNNDFYRKKFIASGVRPEDLRALEDMRKFPPSKKVNSEAATGRQNSSSGQRVMNNPGEIQAWRFFFEEFGCNHENLDKG